jgi:hypothetical protein
LGFDGYVYTHRCLPFLDIEEMKDLRSRHRSSLPITR